LRKLGTGGFSDVFLAKNMDTEKLCALKVIVKNSDFDNEFEEFIQKEIDTMKGLNHKYILNLLDSSLHAQYK
jgi:serine/threonine protein kinase